MITINVNRSVASFMAGANEIERVRSIFDNAPDAAATLGDSVRSSTSNLLYLLDALPEAIWTDPHNLLTEARALRAIQQQDRNQWDLYEDEFPFKLPPLDFQKPIFAAARLMKNIALTPVAMGTGKTKMILDVAADKFMRGEIDCLCVIAPNGVHKQWVETAIPMHMSPAVPIFAAVWKPTRRTPARVTIVNRAALRVLTFNVESFSSESGKAFIAARQFLQSGNSMLVVDESSRIKNPRAVRTKSIQKLRMYAKVRANLSGTPITRGLEDLYTQYAQLDPNIIGLSNYYSFRNRYCVTVPIYGAAPGAVRIVGYRNVEEFVNKIAPCTFVVPKDVLGLPEKTYERRPVPLTDEQRRIYGALNKELVEELRTQHIKTPANAAVRLLRMQQVLCGIKVEVEEREVENPEDGEADTLIITSSTPISSRRLEVLYNVLLEHQGPAVIWARFTEDIRDIVSFLEEEGHRVVSYHGETTEHDRAEAVRRFRTGEADYFIANPDAAGTGLDGLQVAQLAVYYSNSFRAESRWQSEDRIHRIGMAGRAHYVDLVADMGDDSPTVDHLVLMNLKTKGDLARAVFTNPSLLNESADALSQQEEELEQFERA